MAMWWCGAVAVALVLLLPADASAWGPITHLTHGAEVLRNLTIAGVALQRLLRGHRLEYLYGCVGADITQAKKYTRAEQAHCHSWPVAWALVERARNEAQRAFAYGYLTHLAGDVYSHNHFVPTQLIVSFRTRTLRHIYWEARFDTQQRAEHRSIIRELRQHRFPECDALVEDVVARTLFSFRTDRRIFRGFIAVHDLAQWHRIMHRLSANSRYGLSRDIVHRYNTACLGSIMDVLRRGKRAECQRADPTGTEAIALAKDLRRSLKALARRGGVPEALQSAVDALDERMDLVPAEPACAGALALAR